MSDFIKTGGTSTMEQPAFASQSAAQVPPGPRGHWLWGSFAEYTRDSPRFLLRVREQYGDVVRLRLGPATLYLVAHPAGVQHVLQDRQTNYRKYDRLLDAIRPVAGNGLFSSEGDLWRRQRRLMQPAFHRQRLANLGATMVAVTVRMAEERWPAMLSPSPASVLDISEEMMRLTLEIVARSLFGADVRDAVATIGRAMREALAGTDRRLNALLPVPAWWPSQANRRYRAAITTLETVVARLIAARRRDAAERDDLLGLLLAARDADTGEPMDDPQLRDEVMTIFLAGHETTAVALTWALYYLASHPDVMRRLRQELSAVLGERWPTVDDLPRLPFTLQVIHEALRLDPPAWALPRVPAQNDVVAGYRIPAGAVVMVSQYVTHRHPAFWPDPERFDPERFSPAQVAQRPRYAYFPFGGGPRLCIGQSFALLEMHLVLATLLARYDFDLVEGHQVVADTDFTLRPRGGLPMVVRPRLPVHER
jgi:cytochrome P450